jgi:rubrerythrin
MSRETGCSFLLVGTVGLRILALGKHARSAGVSCEQREEVRRLQSNGSVVGTKKGRSTIMRAVRLSTFLFSSVVVLGLGCVASAASSGATLKNLQSAFNGESNARARYLAFATKADKEGYGAVGSLFRAAARAEEIHLNNHAAVIEKIGAEPRADVKSPAVATTKSNLVESASKGEAYERDTMYPRFIKQAKTDGNQDAVQSFEYAKEAEAEHFNLFTVAARSLQKNERRDYYVCTVSGYTMAELDSKKCPGGTYETVN